MMISYTFTIENSSSLFLVDLTKEEKHLADTKQLTDGLSLKGRVKIVRL